MDNAEIIRDYLADNPEMGTRTLAKLIYRELPHVFTSKEQIRGIIRYHRNEHTRSPNASTDFVGVRTEEQKKEAMGWSKLPKSLAEPFDDFVMPLAATRILVLSDIHFPFHDEQALAIALQYGKDKNANAIILNGDIMDCYQLSRYTRDPRHFDIQVEIDNMIQFLELLKEEFRCPVYFKAGNHEERFMNYLKVKAPELLGVAEFRLDVLCKFGELGVVNVPDKRIIKAGKLSVLHGHEFGNTTFSPVNPARGFYLRAKRSMLAGHYHATSEHSEKDLLGEVTTVWSTGCLCDLQPEYRPFNRWNHGAAMVYVGEDGQYEVDNFRIIEGRVR